MADHQIRLRGGWELQDRDEVDDRPKPLTLPVLWEACSSPRRFRLVRRFGKPKSGRVRLLLENVEGLRNATLNGEPLFRNVSPPSSGMIRVDLPPLLDRNALVLDVEFHATPVAEATPWGGVSLSIDEPGDGASSSDDGAR